MPSVYAALLFTIYFGLIDQASSVKIHPTIFLLGDSTMRRTAVALTSFLDHCIPARNGSRCDFPAYYGTPYDETAFNVSIPDHLGPVLYGKQHRGCQDCSGCGPQRWNCSDIDVEFIGIDFAADVEYPTLNHSLTQGSIILGYLKKNAKVSDFVVFSTGAHDSATTGEVPAIFAKQLENYADMLLEVYARSRIVWLTNTYPKDSLLKRRWRSITSSLVLSKLNEVSKDVMVKRGIQILDVALLSKFHHFYALHKDAIHVGKEMQPWYRSVAFTVLVQFYGPMMSSIHESDSRKIAPISVKSTIVPLYQTIAADKS